jgi:tetratricopeptide (TPR) repeat protein
MKLFFQISILFFSLLLTSCGEPKTNDLPLIPSPQSDSEVAKLNTPELKAVNEELKKNPNDPELYIKRSRIYIGLKEFNAALGDANRVMALDSSKAEHYLALADVYFASNKTRQAKDILERTAKKFPDNTDALLKLGELYYFVKQYDNAMTFINSALKADENLAKGYYLKGSVFKELGDTAKAISSMNTAVEQDNKYYQAYIDLGLLYAARRNPLAFEYYDNALRLKVNDQDAMYNKAKLLQDLNKTEESLMLYEDLLKVNPNHSEALYNIGAIYLDRKKQTNKALDYFSKAIVTDPQYTEAYFARGVCFEMLKDYNNAKADYQMSLQITPNYEPSIEALNNLEKNKH